MPERGKPISLNDTNATKVEGSPEAEPIKGAPIKGESNAPAPQKKAQAASSHQRVLMALRQKRLKATIVRFLVAWVGFMVAFAAVNLLSNLEWARPKVEQAMDDAFHRKVKLGRIGWTLGLNGLSIWSDKLSMTEQDGRPFVVAGESEIGVAFLPLVQKKVIIKHLQFHHPEVFATQLAPGKWNFSDLLVEGPEIHYVQVDDGVLHLKNLIKDDKRSAQPGGDILANGNWRSYDFQNVDVKLIFPKKFQTRPWPFYLSFKLPRTQGDRPYTSKVSFTALCSGQFDEWHKRPCQVEVTATRINPDDWRPLLKFPKGLNALFDFSYKGKGLITQVIEGQLTGAAHDIAVTSAKQQVFSAPEATFDGHVSVSARQVGWDKARIDVAGVDISSHGQMNGWLEPNPTYKTFLSANLSNLSQLHDTSFWRMLPGFNQKKQQMTGAAEIELTIEGDGKNRTIATSLKANGVPLTNLLTAEGQKGAPFLSLFKVSEDAPIQGQISIGSDKTISLVDVQVPANGSVLKIDGVLNAEKHEHNIEVSSEDLILDRFDTAKLEEGKAPSILLSGKIDLDAHLTSDKSGQKVAVNATLKNSVISAGKSKLADKLLGDIAFDGSVLHLDHVTGSIDNKDGTHGTIMISGSIETAGRKPQCSLLMTGKHVNITQLVDFCQSAHLPVSGSAISDMSGIASQVEIKIDGDANAPKLTLSITPSDVAYQVTPPKGGVLKPVRITGGTIVLTSNHLELKDLPVTAQSGKLTLSASFAGSGNDLAPTMIHVKSGGVSIEEVQQYLESPDMPIETRTTFENLVAPLKLRAAEGKVSGELKVSLNRNGTSAMEGNLGFANMSGKVFDQQVPFANMCGVSIVSANDLQLKDITFSSGGSHFFVDGEVKNIQQSPAWNLHVNAQVRPEDLLAGLPSDLHGTLSGSASSTMTLQATVTGDAESDKITFSSRSHAGSDLKIKGPGWCFRQPADKTVTADGAFIIRSDGKNNSMQIEGCHLFIGDAALQGSGKYEWISKSSKPDNMELLLTAQNPVPSGLVLSTVFPDADMAGSGGTMKGTLAFAGTVDNLLTHGDFSLNDVSIPSWSIKDLNGRLHSPRWSSNVPLGAMSQLQVQLDSANVGGLPARDITGTIVFENGKEDKVSLNDGAATAAGGRVKLAAWFLPDSEKWHLDMDLEGLEINEFVKGLIDRSGEVTGLAQGHIILDGRGTTFDDMIGKLNGSGEIHVGKGTMPKMAHLQEKLTQANLLQQGLFGFNFNNVLQSVLPGKSGKFKEANLAFEITNGVMDVETATFMGSDLRLRAAGTWNIAQNALNVDVAGNIPRVASSILPGPVGEVSRSITIQKAVRVVTFNKLESLPSVPLLGDIGTDDPRAFTFKVSCSLANPNAVQQSISKSFKWLPNKPNASAHPIPGFPNLTSYLPASAQ